MRSGILPPISRPSAADLSFARAKRRSLLRSAAYRSQPLLRRIFGEDRILRWLLNVERVSWRLAFEAAGKRFGEDFHNRLALTPTTLDEWLPAGARVLDVGCGHGQFGRALGDRVESYLGIDHNEQSIKAARELGHLPNVRFEVGDARELPNGEFDVALLIHVLEHIEDPEALLRDVARLAPTVIVEVPDFDRCILNPVRWELGLDFSSDDDHVREYTRVLLCDQLEASGWRVVSETRSPMSLAALAAIDR